MKDVLLGGILVFVLVFIIIGIVFYTAFTFALYEFNPTLWSMESRTGYVICILIFGTIGGAIACGIVAPKDEK